MTETSSPTIGLQESTKNDTDRILETVVSDFK